MPKVQTIVSKKKKSVNVCPCTTCATDWENWDSLGAVGEIAIDQMTHATRTPIAQGTLLCPERPQTISAHAVTALLSLAKTTRRHNEPDSSTANYAHRLASKKANAYNATIWLLVLINCYWHQCRGKKMRKHQYRHSWRGW